MQVPVYERITNAYTVIILNSANLVVKKCIDYMYLKYLNLSIGVLAGEGGGGGGWGGGNDYYTLPLIFKLQ